MQDLRVSVVIPTYNRDNLIARSLCSALCETRSGDEILVIDDGSTDRTEQVVRQFNDSRIRYVWQPNAGAGAARNRGAREATGDLLAYLDSDDEWLPGKIALQRGFMAARPDVLFCFTDMAGERGEWRRRHYIRHWHTDPRGWEEIMGPPINYSCLGELPLRIPDFSVYVGDIYRGEMHTNYILTSSLMISRGRAGDAIQFNETTKTYEDWECFGRLAQRGLAAYLDCETTVQHVHRGRRLTDANLLTCADARLAILNNVWGSDPVFLSKYGEEYRALVQQQQLQKVRGLLALGRRREASHAVRALTSVPMIYRALCRLPGGLVAALVEFRRALDIRLERATFLSARLKEETEA
jgi:hypothetical protein